MGETETEQQGTQEEGTGPLEIPTPLTETDEEGVTGPTTIPDEGDEGDGEQEQIEGPGDEPGEAQEGSQEPAEGEYEPGVQEAQLLSEREIEKRFAKLDAENTRHRKRLGEILEEDALHIVPCPVCMDSFHGWVFDPQHIPLEDSQRERTLQLLNLADFEDIPQASWAQKCGTCNGHGRVKTGSRAEGREVTQCLDCGGAGWHNLHQRQQTNGHAEAEIPATTGPTVYGTDEPDPRILSLREEGYMVVPPTNLPTGV